jgi:hypothetical protein
MRQLQRLLLALHYWYGARYQQAIPFPLQSGHLLYSPNCQRLPASAITSSEDAVLVGRIFLEETGINNQGEVTRPAEPTLCGVWILDRPSALTSRAFRSSCCGPRKPRARKTSCALKNFSDPGTSSIFHRPPLSFVHSTRTNNQRLAFIKTSLSRKDLPVLRPASLPCSSTTNSLVEMQNSRGSI